MNDLGELLARLELDVGSAKANAKAIRSELAAIGPSAQSGGAVASTALKNLDTQGAKTLSTFKGIGKGFAQGLGLGVGLGGVGLAIAAGQQLKSVLTDMTTSALDDEASISRLSAALQANVPAWNGDTSAIEARIKASERLGFSDAEQRDSLARLVAATHDSTQALVLEKTAMDLARFRRIDLATASTALTLVEGGVYRSLKSLGIVLKDGATQTEALAAVEKVAGGQAEAYANTNQGKLTASQVKLDEVMVRLGEKTMPVLVDVMGAVADSAGPVVDRLGEIAAAAQHVVDVADNLVGANTAAADSTDFLGSKTDPLGKALHGLADDMQWLANYSHDEAFGSHLVADALVAQATAARAAQAATDDLRESASLNALTAHISTEVAPAPTFHDSPVAQMLADLQTQVDAGKTTIDQAAQIIVDRFGTDLGALKEIGKLAGTDLMLAIAKGEAASEDAPLAALKDLHTRLNSEASKERQEAFLLAALTGKDIANGLKSSDPAVRAQAIASRMVITDQLDLLTKGAYSIGSNAGLLFAQGLSDSMAAAMPAAAREHAQQIAMAKPIKTDLGLSKGGLDQGQKDYLAWLKSLDPAAKAASSALGGLSSAVSTLAADARAKFKNAFDEMKTAARSFFDTLHDKNLRAISDAHDLANAQRQGKLDTARSALDAKRNNEQLFQLQKAVGQATTAEDRQSAMIALADFQAQLEIDAQQKVVDAQNKIEDQKAADAKAAEDKRYTAQIAGFNKELAALQGHLARHPEEWRKTQRDVLALLAKYGINYVAAGQALGAKFVAGLRSSLKDAEAAARALAAAGTPKPKPKGSTPAAPTGSGYASGSPAYSSDGTKKPHAAGAWDISGTEDAILHAREMVLRPDIADSVRAAVGSAGMAGIVPMLRAGSGRGSSGSGGAMAGFSGMGAGAISAMRQITPVGGTQGGGTIIFQVGSEKLAEFTDRGLYVQHSVYAKPVVHNGLQR